MVRARRGGPCVWRRECRSRRECGRQVSVHVCNNAQVTEHLRQRLPPESGLQVSLRKAVLSVEMKWLILGLHLGGYIGIAAAMGVLGPSEPPPKPGEIGEYDPPAKDDEYTGLSTPLVCSTGISCPKDE